jgi:hypothetical protein
MTGKITTPHMKRPRPHGCTRFIRHLVLTAVLALPVIAATEYHVATTGDDDHPGTATRPLRSIQAAADRAQPGDVITVHSGVYRERINPPRGGTSGSRRIIYQAAPGEKAVITGSEPVKGWVKEKNDTWRVTLPNTFFAAFNPYADILKGDWWSGLSRWRLVDRNAQAGGCHATCGKPSVLVRERG